MPDDLKDAIAAGQPAAPTDGVVLDPTQDGGAAAVNPPADPAKTPEPTMAEIVAAEMSKLIDPINQRFDDFGRQIEEIKGAAPTQEPAKAEPKQNWQPKTWDDFPALVEQMGREAAEKVLAERDAAVKASTDQAAATQKEIDDNLDSQIGDLEKSGKLPKIADAQDPNDPGKEARRELFGFAYHLGTPDLVKAQGVLDNLHAAGNKFDHRAGQIIQGAKSNPGRTAPVGSSSAAAGNANPQNPSYKDIAGMRSLDDIVSRFG